MKRKLIVGSIVGVICVAAIIIISVLAITGGGKSPETIAKKFTNAMKSEKEMDKYLDKHFDFKLSFAIDKTMENDDYLYNDKDFNDAVNDELNNVKSDELADYEAEVREELKGLVDAGAKLKFKKLSEEKDFPGEDNLKYRVATYLDTDKDEQYTSFVFYNKKLVLVMYDNLDEFYEDYEEDIEVDEEEDEEYDDEEEIVEEEEKDPTNMTQEQKVAYNEQFSTYEGEEVAGTEVIALLNLIMSSNTSNVGKDGVFTSVIPYDFSNLENEDEILNACLDAEDVNSKENVDKVNTELETLKNIIDTNKTYEVEFDYEFDILRVVFITENS